MATVAAAAAETQAATTATSAASRRRYESRLGLWWFAPFFSGGGYCSEAISFVTHLEGRVDIAITHHGDSFHWEFVQGLPEETSDSLGRLAEKNLDATKSIIVCHSEPGAWAPPAYSTSLCPPSRKSLYVVGRTMFETDRLTPGHVARCNKMDEIWVPSKFHVDTFTRSGVMPEKIHVIPEAVEVGIFNPAEVDRPLELASRVAYPPVRFLQQPSAVDVERTCFKFLSVFKWEARKGWDVLLKAYLTEFSNSDDVCLFLKTNHYHSDVPFEEEIQKLLLHPQSTDFELEAEQWTLLPEVVIIDEDIPTTDMPRLYAAVDAFVLPSRGEGWGRPHVEAMAMELPVIATYWSGPVDYMTPSNSYPLEVTEFSEITSGAFRGHRWAEPSVAELRRLMRHVWEHPTEAKRKGQQARQDMVERYSPPVVASQVIRRMNEIEHLLDLRRQQRDEL